MKIERESLLKALETVVPGLASERAAEGANMFQFGDGLVHTFNDETFCQARVSLDVSASVDSATFLALIRKMPDKEVDVSEADGKLLVSGSRRKAEFVVDSMEMRAPFDAESLDGWEKLPDKFSDAASVVSGFASRDASAFPLVCVHLTDRWIEATDDLRIVRWPMKLGLSNPALVRYDTMKGVVGFNPVEVALDDDWLVFRREDGACLGCRRWATEYPDLSKFLDVPGGEKVGLPEEMLGAVERAGIVTDESMDNLIQVSLRKGKAKVRGLGETARYDEVVDVKYDGPDVTFRTTPANLVSVVKDSKSCTVAEGRLKIVVDDCEMVFSTLAEED